jgi:hypothetical protein
MRSLRSLLQVRQKFCETLLEVLDWVLPEPVLLEQGVIFACGRISSLEVQLIFSKLEQT